MPHGQGGSEVGVTFFSFDYPPNDGGISRLCEELVNNLTRNNVPLTVISKAAASSRAVSGAEAVQRIPGGRPWREFRAIRALRKRKASGGAICSIWYPEGLIAWLSGIRPLIIFAHGNEILPTISFPRALFWNHLRRKILTTADLVVANSHYTAELVKKNSPAAKIAAIPLGVDHERFQPGNQEAARRKLGIVAQRVLCSVSRLQDYKGHETVLRALASLPEGERQKITYIIAGKGPHERALRDLAERLGVSHLIHWLGFISEAELPLVYQAADVFVLCTRHTANPPVVEGFGLVFLEAQACATPVIGTRTGGIVDAIDEKAGGWFIEQDDFSRLAKLLHNLVVDPRVYREAGRLARFRVENECTWDHYSQELIAALNSYGISLDREQRANIPLI